MRQNQPASAPPAAAHQRQREEAAPKLEGNAADEEAKMNVSLGLGAPQYT